jgi:exonuclease VII large subunit
MFDRLLRKKPRATEYAIESVIMCRRNQMSEWRESLDEEKKRKLMKMAQESVNEQKKMMLERKTMRFQEREEMIEKKDAKERREQPERETVRKIVQEMNASGPVWMSVKDMNDMSCGKSEKEQECLLKVQLRYRKKVMKAGRAKKGLLNVE